MTRQQAHSRGFTLAEALVAMAILAMIGTLTYGTFAQAMSSRERAESITRHYHEMRQAMLRMSRELSMAYLSAHRDCEDPRSKTVFATRRSGGGMRLDFTSFSHYKVRADANESDQNELSYFVDRDPDDPTQQALMRREATRIDEEPEEGGSEEVLAHRVTDLRFSFYNARDDRWEDDWDSTGSDNRNELPLFVRMELVTKDPSGKDETFVTKTRVFLRKQILILGTGARVCTD